MATVAPVIAHPTAHWGFGTDTTQLPAISLALNTPSLLSMDSVRRVFPIYFCGEEVPVNEPLVMRRWLRTLAAESADAECLYNIRKRAALFFPIIEPILIQYRIPLDFKFIPLAESDLINDCVSPKGAAGYWQMMPGTARDLGLTVTPTLDERRNLRKSTIAVCRLLRDLHRELGSWTLVAAAYNGGIGHIQNRMEQQGHRNYYGLHLFRETNQYLFRVLAYKELMTNPRQYSLLLTKSAMRHLTRPLPAHLRLQVAGNQPKGGHSVAPDDAISPTWGPRADDSLLGELSVFEQFLYAFDEPTPDDPHNLGEQRSGIPVKKLMALTVLRFRRPRFLQKQPGAGLRPVHRWEWV